MSAWDLAIAARDLMANPALASIVRLTTYRFTGPDGIVYELSSHNRAFLNSYPGAIGVKTGFTDPAGVCVAEEAVRGGRAMLAVVMNGVSPDQTAADAARPGVRHPGRPEATNPGGSPPPRQPEPHPEPAAPRLARRAAAAAARRPPAALVPRRAQPAPWRHPSAEVFPTSRWRGRGGGRGGSSWAWRRAWACGGSAAARGAPAGAAGVYPPETSWGRWDPALMKGIMARSSAPTFSMGWARPFLAELVEAGAAGLVLGDPLVGEPTGLDLVQDPSSSPPGPRR